MLSTYRKGACALAAALTVMAGAAHAKNHTVLIVDGGFFPAVTYADPGDNIVFTNSSAGNIVLKGADDSWNSGAIHMDATYSLDITPDMSLDFVAVDANSGYTGEENEETSEYIALDDVLMEGSISFSAPPLAD